MGRPGGKKRKQKHVYRNKYERFSHAEERRKEIESGYKEGHPRNEDYKILSQGNLEKSADELFLESFHFHHYKKKPRK